MYFESKVFFRCYFANDSLANGCRIRLMLDKDSASNETEDFDVSRELGYMCNSTDNRFETYSSVVGFDIEANGSVGNVSLPVSRVKTDSMEEYIEGTENRCQDSNECN